QHNTLNPVWAETHTFRDVTAHGELTLAVLDQDRFNEDDPMGSFTIAFNTLDLEQSLHTWFTLEGVERGEIRLQLNFEPL
ncbi:MAG: C2 domain-containing protein, partial [Myxococcota bacterium]